MGTSRPRTPHRILHEARALLPKTEVTGAKEAVAGLATMKGTRVTVHFTEAGNIKTATRIQVEPRQAEVPPAR
jgi:hypothetical protein